MYESLLEEMDGAAACRDERGRASSSEAVVSRDMLAELLPDDEVIVLTEPEVAGGFAYRLAKRAFDVVACGAALLVLLVPMAVIAAKIKLESPGPVIYRQCRVGKGGRLFDVYKFRTMRTDAEASGAQWAHEDDPRVTRVGRFLRSTRLDEVPQFVNVIKGEMSLVGPRPERPVFCEAFEKRIHGWHYRTLVAPGISGLAQVEGGYDLLPKEKVLLDLEYIESRSLAVDIEIMTKTLGTVLFRRGAR